MTDGKMTPMTEQTEEAVLYRTAGRQNEAFYQEIKWHMVSRAYRVRCALLMIGVALVAAGWAMIERQPILLLLIPVYMLLLAGQYVWAVNRSVKRAAGRLKELAPEGEVRTVTSCVEEGVRSENLTNGGVVTVPYSAFVRSAETAHYLMLMTRKGMTLVFYLDSLDEQNRQSLRELLRQRCPQVRL